MQCERHALTYRARPRSRQFPHRSDRSPNWNLDPCEPSEGPL